MVTLFVLLLALIIGNVCLGEELAVEPLPAALQQPPYAAPVLEPMEVPFPEMEVGCSEECVDCGPMCAQPSYWYGGVDLLATQFSYHFSNSIFLADDDAGLAVRPYLGWEGPNGVGIRGRWWFFGTETATRSIGGPPNVPFVLDTLDFDANSLDLDFYRRFYYDRTSFLLGAGTKVASFEFSNGSFSNDIIGGGLSVFVEGHHPLYIGPKNEWSFVGYGRFALLTGRVEYESRPNGWEYVDTNMSITEVGLGLEWKHKFRRGDFICQLLSEIQRWETNMTSDIAFDSIGLRFGGQW